MTELFRLYLIVGGLPAAYVFYNGNINTQEKVVYYPVYMLMFIQKKNWTN